MEEILKPGVPYYIMVGIAGITLLLFGFFAVGRLVQKRQTHGSLTWLFAAAVCFFGVLLDIQYPRVAGFVGGFGVVLLLMAWLEANHFSFPFPWWAAVVSFLMGLWLLLAFPGIVRDWPDFVQSFSFVPWMAVVVLLVGTGGLQIVEGVLDRFFPHKNKS